MPGTRILQHTTLSQSSGDWSAITQIAIYCAIAIVLIIAGAIIAFWIRRRAMGEDSSPTSSATPFTLQDLRDMRASGDLDEDQYHTLRDQLIGSVKPASNPIADARKQRAAEPPEQSPQPPPTDPTH